MHKYAYLVNQSQEKYLRNCCRIKREYSDYIQMKRGIGRFMALFSFLLPLNNFCVEPEQHLLNRDGGWCNISRVKIFWWCLFSFGNSSGLPLHLRERLRS